MAIQDEQIEVQENVEQDVPQRDPPVKLLWQELHNSEYYTKSFDEFQKQFGSRENISALWKELNKTEYYTKDENEFVNQFFPTIKKKVGSQDLSQSAAPSVSEVQSTSKDKGFFSSLRETMERGRDAANAQKQEKAKSLDPNDPKNFDLQNRIFKPQTETASIKGKGILEAHKEEALKRGTNRSGYIWNKFTKGLGRVFSGSIELLMNVLKSLICFWF